MSKTPYWEKLQDPRWQKKRLEIMNRDEFRCRNCGDSDKTLAVHHRYYVSGRDPWEYPGFALQTLCRQCHKDGHEFIDRDEAGNVISEEWEHELNWLTDGGARYDTIGDMWHAMAALSDGLEVCKKHREFWKEVEAAIRAITVAREERA